MAPREGADADFHGRTNQRTDGPTYGHSLIDLPRYDSMVKETHGTEHFCRCSSTGSNSQSECSDFGYGPITAEICLATSGEVENLPLEARNFPHLSNDGKFEMRPV